MGTLCWVRRVTIRPLAILVSLLAALSMVLAACGGGDGEEAQPTSPPAATARPAATPTAAPAATPTPAPKRGGVLRLRLTRSWPIRDTYDSRGGYAQVFTSPIMNNLVTANPYNFQTSEEIIGDLAASWEITGDGTVYTFRLNRGVTWHDGTPFTSKDVAYSYNRAINPPAPQIVWNRNRVANISAIETPDDGTVVIRTKVASVAFLRGLSLNFMQIMPSHVPDMAVFNAKVTGTGPFKLKADKQDEIHELERNPNYFRKDAAGQALPYLDGITYTIIGDPTNALAAFRTGRIRANPGTYDSDWAPQQAAIVRAEFPKINEQKYTSSRWDAVINGSLPVFQDIRVRQAIALAIAHQDFDTVVYGGTGEPLASGMLPPSLGGTWGLAKDEMLRVPGYNPATKAADIDRAKALLKEAGLSNVKWRIVTSNQAALSRGAEVISTQLRALGVDTTLIPIGNELNEVLRRGDFDINVNVATLDFDDPAAYVTPWVRTGGASNYGKWSIAKIDQLLDEADKTFDVAKRRQIITDLQREILAQLPIIHIDFSTGPNFWQNEIKNWPRVYTALSPAYKFDQVWIDDTTK